MTILQYIEIFLNLRDGAYATLSYLTSLKKEKKTSKSLQSKSVMGGTFQIIELDLSYPLMPRVGLPGLMCFDPESL